MLKGEGPAPGSAAEQPDKVMPLSEPLFAAALGDGTWSCSQFSLQELTTAHSEDLWFQQGIPQSHCNANEC